jgi:hypothetical protein
LLIFSAELLIDNQRQHYGLPEPQTLERLLLLNSAEQQLRRRLKQIQILEVQGARHLAEQLAIQVLASQNAIPGLNTPRNLGYGLGPDFDETYLSPLRREYGGVVPLDAIGYGRGISGWNHDVLPQMMAAAAAGNGRGLGFGNGSRGANPWSQTGMFPGMNSNRAYGFPGSWPPGMQFGGGGNGPWGGSMGGSGPSNFQRFVETVRCDGGNGNRYRRFD